MKNAKRTWQGGRLTHDEQLAMIGNILKNAAKLDRDSRFYVVRRLVATLDDKPEAIPTPVEDDATLLPFLPARDRTAADHDA